ncbi:hypothetical protein K0M31_004192 [Melipona bicolor]|uniref:Uncharacterized protein n=1 Tax=Melipona bicolor TaxID=60889 RepID=A0AA40KN24_9HYME|nr:hypothetical protein K0M31_004192 [Melipona bicolor]
MLLSPLVERTRTDGRVGGGGGGVGVGNGGGGGAAVSAPAADGADGRGCGCGCGCGCDCGRGRDRAAHAAVVYDDAVDEGVVQPVAAVVVAASPAPKNHRLDRRPRSPLSLDRDNPWIIETRNNFFKFRLLRPRRSTLPPDSFL